MADPSSARPPLFIRLSLPGGLEEALESLAREVLREQPKDICQFAAQHFEQQLRKRNKGTCCVRMVQPRTCMFIVVFLPEQGFSPDHDLEFFSPKAANGAGSEFGQDEHEEKKDEETEKEPKAKAEADGTLLESISGKKA